MSPFPAGFHQWNYCRCCRGLPHFGCRGITLLLSSSDGKTATMKHLMRWLCCCALLAVFSAGAATPTVQVRSTKAEFTEVKERLVMALENRGLVLNYTARVGEMLDRTGHDLGRDRQVYVKAEVLEFCSAALSRDTMEADPRNIVFCPYAIAIYTLPRAPGTVYLSYRAPVALGSGHSIHALRKVEKLLADVVAEALK